ncbi:MULTISPECIES: amidase [unclassified Variovorax]|uniref:amidase n=1 Tax=unclassified Variovorax TaxID=663243 RepID=UPI002577ABFB|nr:MULTISPECIES: amidase [unclassified Variovorax]MDM0089251.1 amidase [Variovorax sp. J22G40]MDM0147324.1 amidase [Variovorax sp. J2P1-31]
MSSIEIPLDSATDLSQALSRGELTSVAIVTACLARIRAHDPQLHAFSEVYADEALAAADAADRMMRAGYRLGPLHGIPVAVKDLVDIAGKATTNGSPLFANRIAQRNARMVDLLRAAGAIIVGKTHMVQFALGAWGTNEHMGTPRNPWDPATHRTPGGSSSGSAVAVAAGLVPLAIGSDTGGSVRIPAAFCGITGFKATAGAIDTTGVVSLSTTLDSIGVFARAAKDAALLHAVLAEDRARPAQVPTATGSQAFAGLRLARLGPSDLVGVEPDVLAAYEAAMTVFAQGGAQVTVVAMPRPLDTFAQTTSAIMLTEAAAEHGELAADAMAAMDTSVRPRIAAGARLLAVDYVRAMRQREAWKREFTALLSRSDALVTPTTMATAVPIDSVDHGNAPVRYTRILNLLDMCGVSVPAGVDGGGLPIGVQIAAATGHDAQLIAIAEAFQRCTDFHRHTPELRAA